MKNSNLYVIQAKDLLAYTVNMPTYINEKRIIKGLKMLNNSVNLTEEELSIPILVVHDEIIEETIFEEDEKIIANNYYSYFTKDEFRILNNIEKTFDINNQNDIDELKRISLCFKPSSLKLASSINNASTAENIVLMKQIISNYKGDIKTLNKVLNILKAKAILLQQISIDINLKMIENNHVSNEYNELLKKVKQKIK